MADLWSDFTDILIKSMDKEWSGKYRVTLKDLLTDPSKYFAQTNIQVMISNMEQDVNGYIDEKLKNLGDEEKAFEDAAVKADSITKQLMQSISSQAKQYKIPIITPVSVNRDETKDETIYVDAFDGNISALVEKLTASSTLIADFGSEFRNYKMGEWLFSGAKNYVLSVFVPQNNVMLLENSRDEIQSLLEAASDFVKGL